MFSNYYIYALLYIGLSLEIYEFYIISATHIIHTPEYQKYELRSKQRVYNSKIDSQQIMNSNTIKI